MTRSTRKILRRGLLKTPGRFIAIFCMVALGAGFFTGLQSAGPSMARTAEAYFEQTNAMDFKLICDMGITQEDIEALRALPQIAEISPSYTLYVKASTLEQTPVVAIHGLPSEGTSGLSTPVLEEGRMPSKPGECLVDANSSVQLGEVIEVSKDNRESTLELLKTQRFEVVGRAWSPAYLAVSRGNTNVGGGRVDYYLYVLPSAFKGEYYTELNLRLRDSVSEPAFSEGYDDLIEANIAALESFGLERGSLRYEQIWQEASAQLADAETEYEETKVQADYDLAVALQEIESGRMSLEEGEASYSFYAGELAAAQSRVEAGRSALAQAGRTLDDNRAKLASSAALLDGARRELVLAQDTVNQLLLQLDAAIDPVEATEIQAQIDALNMQVDALAAQIKAGESELAFAQTALEGAEREYQANATFLATSESSVAANAGTLAQMRGELDYRTAELALGQELYAEESEEALTALEQARKELDENAEALDILETPVWYVQSRQDFPGYAGLASDIKRVGALANILPLLLFLISTLVSLTTMTRLVEEQRMQIGILKALGYQRRSIFFAYQWYAWTISLFGGIAGVLLGLALVPDAIWQIYDVFYHLGDFELAIVALPCVGGLVISALAVSLATYAACKKALGSTASELMRFQPPRLGKRVLLERIKPLWSVLPLGYKVTFRNLFRYKARFFMTIVGVAGCTALLLTGFGIRDSADSIVNLQYGEVAQYEATIVLKKGSDAQTNTALNRTLAQYDIAYAHMAAVDVSAGAFTNDGITTYLFVPQIPSKLNDLINFRDRVTHEPLTFPVTFAQGPSALITERLAKVLNVRAGDIITVGQPRGQLADIRVAGVVENYVYNYIYLSSDAYKMLFREAPVYATLVLKTNLSDTDFAALMTQVATDENVATILPVSQLRGIMDQVIANMTTIVWLLIVASAILALIVLYSLSSINITERIRELATLKVLGFFRAEVSTYISRETTILTLFGLVLGLIAGIFIHQFVIASVEVNEVMFARTILPQSFVFAALTTLLCSALIAFIMRSRIRKIDPVTTLKSNG